MRKKLWTSLALIPLISILPFAQSVLPGKPLPSHSIKSAEAANYPDIQGHWAYRYINSLSRQSMIIGYPDGTFQPEQTVTRAQFTSMVVRALQLPVRETSDFPDTAGHWAAGYMATARLYGIINGFPDGLIHPDEQVTRAQMAAMFVRALHLTQTGNDFPDTTGHWARTAIQKIAARSYMTGLPDGTFAPDQAATRAQAAAVLARILENRPKIVLGYSVKNYPTDNHSLRSIEQYGRFLSHIASFRYTIDPNGQLIEEGKQDPHVAEARKQGLLSLLSVHNNFNADLVGEVMKNESARSNLIRNLLAAIQQKQYVGVNIDLENIPHQYRKQFSQFMRDLRDTLHSKGYLVTIAVPAKQSGGPTGSWLDAYDYKVIGEYADLIVLMTYDEHWFGGQTGPIASYGWTERSLQYALTKIPKDKLLLGIAAYGYDWPETASVNGKAVTAQTMSKLLSQYGGQPTFDQAAKENTYTYTDKNGVKHTVWIEDEESLPYKLELAERYNVRGIGIWRLGLENQAFWNAFQATWKQ